MNEVSHQLILYNRIGTPVHSDTMYQPYTEPGRRQAGFYIEALRRGGFGRFLSGCGNETSCNVAVAPCAVDGVFTAVMRVVRAVEEGGELKWNYGCSTLTEEFQDIVSPAKAKRK